jgi:hypothetical protein
MPPSRRRTAPVRNERGLTILEVLIAAVLLIIVLFWLTQFYVQGRKHIDYEEHRRKATAVAQAGLDGVREWPYDSLMVWVNSGTSLDSTVVMDGRTYDLHLLFAAGPNPNTSEVSAVVAWNAAVPYEPGNAFVRRDTTTTLIGRRFEQ